MYVTSTDRIIGTEREAVGEGWKSRRLMLASEGRPYSLHETQVAAGTSLHLKYARHSETVYCVAGRSELEDVATGTLTKIGPGSLYCAAVGDEHRLRIDETSTFICVFDPPLIGQEEAD